MFSLFCLMKIIEERLATFNVDKTSERRLVFLDTLLTHMHSEKLTLDDIQEQVDTFMFAGHDTTSLAVTFFCYLVGCYPEVQAKVHAEIDSIFGGNTFIYHYVDMVYFFLLR